MSAKKIPVTPIQDRVADRRMLIDRVANLKQQYQQVSDQVGTEKAVASKCAAKLNDFIGGANRANVQEVKWTTFEREEVAALRSDNDQALQRVIETQAQQSNLNESIAAMERQLQTHSLDTSTEDLTRHHSAISRLRDRVARINQLIFEKEQQIAVAESGIPAVVSEDQRPDVLARLALGEADSSELATLDISIEAELAAEKEASTQAISVVQEAEATLIGLRRMLEKTNADLRDLCLTTADIEFDFLRAQAEIAGEQYVEAAEALLQLWARLCAYEDIARVITNDTQNRSVFRLHNCRQLSAPTFRVKACADSKRFKDWLVINPAALDNAVSLARADEVEKLQSYGLTLV